MSEPKVFAIADRVIADRQAPPDPCDGSVSRVNLRLMAGNISSGNNQSTIAGTAFCGSARPSEAE